MRKLILCLIILISITANRVSAQSYKLITYNIRYNNPMDGENAWDIRKEKLTEMLNFYEADILGIQEGLLNQVLFIDSCLPNYQHLGIGRDDGKTKGEYSAIYYKKDKFDVLKTATFWLSETPDTVSKGWDAACLRICTYALLKDKKTQNKFWVFNTHFDHIGENAQKNSAALIIKKITELNKENYAVVLCGDFNMTPEKAAIKQISTKLNDSKILYKGNRDENEGTFNAFDFSKPVTERIDYLFVNKFKVLKYRVLTDSYQCKYLSDHLPVYTEVGF